MLEGRFQITGEPGQVPRLIPAVELNTHAPVLLRLVRPRDLDAQRQLVRDCRLLSRLRHPGLARILEVVEEADKVMIVIDPLRGRSLDEAAKASLDLTQLLHTMNQLAAALEFLHSQEPPISLGRLEPSSIVLTPEDQVLIADFASENLEHLEDAPAASPFWAPEVERTSVATAAQDLYSFGAISWLLATGAPPQQTPLSGEIPVELTELLRHLLQPEPGARPGSIQAVQKRLAALQGQPTSGDSKSPTVASIESQSGKASLWDSLFKPLWSRETARTSSVPDEEGALAREAREKFSLLDLATVDLERSVARLLPESTARSVQGIIVAKPADDELVVALKDPTFVHAYDYVRLAVGSHYKVRLSRAHPDLVDQALEYVYRSEVYAESVSWEEWLVRRRFFRQPLVVENPIADTSMWGEPLPNRVIEAVDTILKEALAVGASDVHFETFRRTMEVRYRIDGVLKRISSFPPEQATAIVKRIKVLANMDIAQERVPQGGRISVRVGDLECNLRVSSVPVPGGESLVLRVLRKSAEHLTLEELGFPEDLQADFGEMLQQPYGMVLVCGPTGSGKTTTLYTSLKMMERPDRKLLTVEDPIEYEMPGVIQVQVDTSPRELEKRVTFARVLREFLRQDPDVILVGEIRDPETAEVAVQAALTGHLLLSTLHANDALGVFSRLREMGIEPFLIGSSLLGVVAQRLARRICTRCREEAEVPAALHQRMLDAGIAVPKAFRGRGCPSCLGTGCRGRVGLYEMAIVNPAVRRCILEGASEAQLVAALQEQKPFRRLQDYGLQLAAQGTVTLDEVLRVTRHQG